MCESPVTVLKVDQVHNEWMNEWINDFSPIFHSPTGFAKLPTIARNQREIGARAREWQSRSVNYQRHDLRESPMRGRRPWIIYFIC